MKWHGMCSSEGRYRLGFAGQNLKEWDYMEVLGVDGRAVV
jgi:hypothetical protein